jgi:hypothetical protein
MSHIKKFNSLHSGFKKLKTLLLRTVTLMTYCCTFRSPVALSLVALNMMIHRNPTPAI